MTSPMRAPYNARWSGTGSLAIINGVSGGGPVGGGTGVTGVESQVSGGRPRQPAGLRAFW
jgi:hypothetical protein